VHSRLDFIAENMLSEFINEEKSHRLVDKVDRLVAHWQEALLLKTNIIFT
jgi:hypothetical protein